MTDVIEDLMQQGVPVASTKDAAALPIETQSVVLDELTDELAVALARLPQLRAILHSGSSKLTDAGASALAKIATLELLDLEWSEGISDAALLSLQHLDRLRWLDLSFCAKLSSNAIEALSQALPSCEIESSAA